MVKRSELKMLTQQLLTFTNTLENKFESVKKTGKSGDFYSEVKPFADEIKEMNDKWRKEALFFVEQKRPKNIHLQQIESAHEHIDIISVQAFFPETSLTRFKNMVASVKYILNQVLIIINEEERELK